MPTKTRHHIPLSAAEARRKREYGTKNDTVTPNSGAILTSYMLQNLRVKKLVEETVPIVVQLTDKQKREKEHSELLEDLFNKYSKEKEEESKSYFDFVNESQEGDRNTRSQALLAPFSNLPPDGSSGTPQNSAR